MSRIGTSGKYIPVHTVLLFFSFFRTPLIFLCLSNLQCPPFKGAQRGVKLRRLHNEGAPLHLPLFLIFYIILNFCFFPLFFLMDSDTPAFTKTLSQLLFVLSHLFFYFLTFFFVECGDFLSLFFSSFIIIFLIPRDRRGQWQKQVGGVIY